MLVKEILFYLVMGGRGGVRREDSVAESCTGTQYSIQNKSLLCSEIKFP